MDQGVRIGVHLLQELDDLSSALRRRLQGVQRIVLLIKQSSHAGELGDFPEDMQGDSRGQ